MTKDEILKKLDHQRQQFHQLVDDLPEEALEEPGVVGEWSLKDVMGHITRWEAELVTLLWQLLQGRKPATMHFGRTPVDEINAAWYQDVRERSLDQIIEDFEGVRKQTIRRVAEFSDQDLNDPNRFPALLLKSNQPLATWIENDSFGHEEEHLEQIRQWRQEKGY